MDFWDPATQESRELQGVSFLYKRYRTRARLNLSQVLDSLKYKPRNIKEMPQNFKEKNWWKSTA